MPTRLRLSFDDAFEQFAEARGEQIRLADAEQPFRLRPLGDDAYVVSGPDGDVSVVAVSGGEGVWVGVDGHVFEVKAHPASGRGHSRAREHDVLGPPMPATVVRIAVGPGDAVRTGDVLIALEAMKMELPIRAPRDGVVAAIHCHVGELVQPGATLVEMT
jgi:3-methylcrotonyl-CoA carboxylase alpha subunit